MTDELQGLMAAVDAYGGAPAETDPQFVFDDYAKIGVEARKLLQGRDAEIEELEADYAVATALLDVHEALADRLAEALTKAYDDADRRAQHVGLDMRVERSDALTAWRESQG